MTLVMMASAVSHSDVCCADCRNAEYNTACLAGKVKPDLKSNPIHTQQLNWLAAHKFCSVTIQKAIL